MSFGATSIDGDLLKRIEAAIPHLTRSDVRIAKRLLAKPEDFVRASVRAIAADIGVSEPTVVRFCRTVGCEGFRDLKFRITQELAVQQAQRDAHPPSAEVQSAGTAPPATSEGDAESPSYPQRLHALAAQAMLTAAEAADPVLIDQAAGMLAQAHKVVVFGLGGSSAILADEVHNRLYRLGVASNVFGDTYAQHMAAATLGACDVVVFVSSTGRPRALQDCHEVAQYYGAQSIGITDRNSRLGRDVDVCLHVDLSQSGVDEFQPNPMRYSQLFMIDLLAYRTGERLGLSARQALRQARASLAALQGIASQQPIGD